MRRPIIPRPPVDDFKAPGRHLPVEQRPPGRPKAARRRARWPRGGRTRRGQRPAQSWANTLEALGLQVTEGPLEVRAVSRPGHPMDVEVIGVPRGAEWAWTVTVHHPGMSPRLVLEPEDRLTRVKKLVVGEDLLTGDEAFDAAVHISGDEVETLARLSHGVRQTVLALLEGGRVAERTVHWAEVGDGPQPATLAGRLRRWMGLARRLSAEMNAEHRLLKLAQQDPEAGCRLRALSLFLTRGARPRAPALARLLGDVDPRVRLRAARIEPSISTLNALAGDDEASVEVRSEAAIALGATADRAAITGIDRAAAVVPSIVVVRALRPWLDRGEAEAVIGELGEAAALAVLADGPRSLRGVVIDRLGAVGTEVAVPELVKLGGAFFGRRALKDQAREAAARITRRIGGLRRGGLSISAGEAGGLAVAPSADPPGGEAAD